MPLRAVHPGMADAGCTEHADGPCSVRQWAMLTGQRIARLADDGGWAHGSCRLVTVSSVIQAELQTDKRRIRLPVSPEDADGPGRFYNRQVIVQAEQVTTWSTDGPGKTHLPPITVRPAGADAPGA
jgi:hypothetical protein